MKRKIINGVPHVLCVALVNTRDAGAPSNLTLIPPNRTISLAGGEEFVTLYIKEEVLPSDWETRT